MVLEHEEYESSTVRDLAYPEWLKNQELEVKDLTIFIDPLDCTRGFVFNTKWECTVLIGATYRK